jgi:hypothetical protein
MPLNLVDTLRISICVDPSSIRPSATGETAASDACSIQKIEYQGRTAFASGQKSLGQARKLCSAPFIANTACVFLGGVIGMIYSAQ